MLTHAFRISITSGKQKVKNEVVDIEKVRRFLDDIGTHKTREGFDRFLDEEEKLELKEEKYETEDLKEEKYETEDFHLLHPNTDLALLAETCNTVTEEPFTDKEFLDHLEEKPSENFHIDTKIFDELKNFGDTLQPFLDIEQKTKQKIKYCRGGCTLMKNTDNKKYTKKNEILYNTKCYKCQIQSKKQIGKKSIGIMYYCSFIGYSCSKAFCGDCYGNQDKKKRKRK